MKYTKKVQLKELNKPLQPRIRNLQQLIFFFSRNTLASLLLHWQLLFVRQLDYFFVLRTKVIKCQYFAGTAAKNNMLVTALSQEPR